MTERGFAIEVVRTLQQAGFRALWAGGCVRDELLGLTPHDFDVATDARPEQVMKLFRRSVAVGAAFGVIEVIGPRGPHHQHLTVEVATFRSDGAYLDGRRPNSVTFSSPEEDAQRRDFTINGMFFDPLAGQLHDFVGGQADLQARVLRAIGDPIARFNEDKLRVLRAVRIAARFDLTIDAQTLAAAQRIAPQITVVSAERIAEELRKLLAHPNRGRGVKLLAECGLTPVIFPELQAAPRPSPTGSSSQRPKKRGSPGSFETAKRSWTLRRCGSASLSRFLRTPASANCCPCTGPLRSPAAALRITSSFANGCCATCRRRNWIRRRSSRETI